MKRDIYSKLVKWKQSQRRKPLILQGARQVGKTTFLKEFGQKEFNDLAYFNFEDDADLKSLFISKVDPQYIVQKLGQYRARPIDPQQTLIFFDEIQESPEALKSLKYFNEKANEYYVVAAGSLLGVKVDKKISFPVGQVNFLNLYPFSFLEFLDGIGKSNLREVLATILSVSPLPQVFHGELINCLLLYFFVGGMPEAINQYNQSPADFETIREVHKEILRAYELDFSKHALPGDVIKISLIWNLIPSQLAKENKKFIFSAIKKSARARDYDTALQWLLDAGLIYKAYQTPAPQLPLSGICQRDIFKVYLLDVGLLSTMARVPQKMFTSSQAIFAEFKGAFTENFVAQELVAYQQEDLHYWTSNGIAEVDFVIPCDGETYPLEVKSGLSNKKKSLKVYDQKYNPTTLIRVSPQNFKHDGKLINYPLYGLSLFPLGIKGA
ncbi:MAG: ATP-binding protein [Deltaproteobacteria bacterium]|nr:ATP-binding protein [Deltaproteobacteria bacterium]